MTERMLPLYEAKMIHHFDHRWATYDEDVTIRDVSAAEKSDPSFAALPRYWVREEEVIKRTERAQGRRWLVGFRGITNNTNERTWISTGLPLTAVGNSLPVVFSSAFEVGFFIACASSFVFDFLARPKVAGSNLNFFIAEQLPVLSAAHATAPWTSLHASAWVERRAIELICTSYDMRALAVDRGDHGEPFLWDPERRFWLRAELDAAFFHLYGVERDDLDYIMETFPIVKRKDIAARGSFRTKEAILNIYDAMAEAVATGMEYQTVLSPPPGDGPRHPAQEAAS